MLATFQPLIDAARNLDLSDPAAAEKTLTERLDPDGPAVAELRNELLKLLEAGEIADRGEMPVQWSRVAKASEETGGFSIDVVHMNGAGPRHRHPKGEIDFCLALDGSPTFDGRAPGWVVLGPDSTHVPTVSDGRMLIVYLLPEGEIEFL